MPGLLAHVWAAFVYVCVVGFYSVHERGGAAPTAAASRLAYEQSNRLPSVCLQVWCVYSGGLCL